MQKTKSILMAFLSLLATLGLLIEPGAQQVAASTGGSVIAYVLPKDSTGDEIHLIDPAGTNDRRIWNTGREGVSGEPEVAELAWKPNSGELAFWSNFQDTCSVYIDDVYTIRPSGSGLRRQTAPPVCGANPGLPTGNVNLAVTNRAGYGTFVVYIEGASNGKFVTLGYGETAVVTFTGVMDFGPGVLQWAAGKWGHESYSDVSSHADVVAGQTINATLDLSHFDRYWGYPTYSSDGSEMAYILNPNLVYRASANSNTPGGIGSLFLANGVAKPPSPTHLRWGRGAHANQILYLGYDMVNYPPSYGIYLADATHNNKILQIDANQFNSVFGLDWLPDGSGFIYSAAETVYSDDCVIQHVGNIYEYKFGSSGPTNISNFKRYPYNSQTGSCGNGPYPFDISISPAGDQIAFEYQAHGEWYDPEPVDLYTINYDGTGMQLLAAGGRSPAWSPQALPVYYYLNISLVFK